MLIFDVKNALQMGIKYRHMFCNRVDLSFEIHLKVVSQPLKEPRQGFLNGEFAGKPLLQITRKTQKLRILLQISETVMEKRDGIFLQRRMRPSKFA